VPFKGRYLLLYHVFQIIEKKRKVRRVDALMRGCVDASQVSLRDDSCCNRSLRSLALRAAKPPMTHA
jgi:hypothetical protein